MDYNSYDSGGIYNTGGGVYRVVLSILCGIMLVILVSNILTAQSSEPLTFTSFLHFLEDNSFSFNFTNFIDYSIPGDWGVFDFLRTFFNFFINILNFFISVINWLVQVLVFVFDFVKFLLFRS